MYRTKTKARHAAKDLNIYDDLRQIKDAFTEATHNVKDRAGLAFTQSMEDAKERGLNLQENFTGYVGEKPIKSVAIALFAGVLLGFFVKR